MQQKYVWMLGFDAMRLKEGVGEVANIEAHNHIGPRSDSCGEDMRVVSVWKRKTGDQAEISLFRYDSVGEGVIHRSSSAFDPLSFLRRIVGEQVPSPFTFDALAPSGLKQTDGGSLQR